MDRLRPEPLIFNAWMRELSNGLLAEALGADAATLQGEHPALIEAGARRHLAVLRRTAAGGKRCADLVSGALDRALDSLARTHGRDMTRWRWGDAHYAPFRHQVFSTIPVRARPRRPTHPYRRRLLHHQPRRHATRAPAMRPSSTSMAPDCARSTTSPTSTRSHFMVTPGQSGNPLSRHWSDLAQDWANGLHFTLDTDRARLQSTGSVLILAPHR